MLGIRAVLVTSAVAEAATVFPIEIRAVAVAAVAVAAVAVIIIVIKLM